MILYKNVDIKDLGSILQKGILSLNESKNNNWNDGKRANNSCDIVYLFKPLREQNSFCQYGAALLEIDMPDDRVKEKALLENDANEEMYIEYTTDAVAPELICGIYIPRIFKGRVDLPEEIVSSITWCDISANYYGDNGKESCTDELLEQFAETAEIMDASEYNFFRGVTEKREMIDLYDIRYELCSYDHPIIAKNRAFKR